MAQRLRRAVPRHPADWFGFYRFDESASEAWRCCRVFDISPLGAGVELFAATPEDRLDGLITVSLELRGSTRGTVKLDEESTVRAAVEFVEPSEAARNFLRCINGTTSRW